MTPNNWPYVAGQAKKRILAPNPHLLIIVEGKQCSKGDSSGVADVYSPHEHGPSVNDQGSGAVRKTGLLKDGCIHQAILAAKV
jgi:hypothetical protein